MKWPFYIWLVLLFTPVSAQDSTASPKTAIQGYLKQLNSLQFNKDFSEVISGNLLHNRINIKLNGKKGWKAGMEMRNRLFWGEEMAQTPQYKKGLTYPGESYNLFFTWIERRNMLLYSNIDRLWLEYGNTKWNIRAGRQRINWGIGTLWNPNDIFNTFNFLDFDYEERPASDAVKGQYISGDVSYVEIAAARTGHSGRHTITALRYFTNKWNYDFQFITGTYLGQPTTGAGWAGNIGKAGFKGETQYFFAHNAAKAQLNMAVETDITFANGWYLAAGGLYNSRGTDEPLTSNLSFDFSPRQPMPTRWNIFIHATHEITPLLMVNCSVVFAPKTNLLLFIPSVQYNLAPNLDADLLAQSFFSEQAQNFRAVTHRGFIRIRWSF